MTLTLPGIVPTPYAGSVADFVKAPGPRDGSVFAKAVQVSIPASTATDTIIGLVPFNKGAKLVGITGFHVADLDSSTNVTIDIGYQYYNSDSGTTDLDAFASALTTPQAGGFVSVADEIDWMEDTMLGDGWFTVQVNAATTTTGNITATLLISYDADLNG